MEFRKIENLLEKYHNAETTLKEEAQLKTYFTSEEVAPHLEVYKPLFQHFSIAKEEQFSKTIPLEEKEKNRLYKWISIAAVTVLMLGILLPNIIGPSQQEQQEALLAYNQTVEALNLLSVGINEGKAQVGSLSLVSDHFNQGIEEASRLNKFSSTTNKLFKNY